MEFKNIIKALRLRQGYTQVDLAELSSLSLRTIQRIENNEVEPTPYSLNQIGGASKRKATLNRVAFFVSALSD